jgi:photosystem II stability/assembly factor-like uncharacterized protein
MKTATRRRNIAVLAFTLAVAAAALTFSGRFGRVGPSYGGEWASLSAGSEEKGLRAVAVDPLNPQKIFIGSTKGVFVSNDAGKVWVNCLDLSSSKRTIPKDLPPAQKSLVDGLLVAGETGDISGITALAVDPANSQKVFAGSVDGIYVCTDGGKSWTRANGTLKGLTVFALGIAIDPSNPDMVYAGTLGSDMLKSMDGGKTWQRVEVAPAESTVSAVAVHPFDSNVIYAGTPDAVFRTKNGGAMWEKVFSQGKAAQSFSIDQVNPSVVYLGTSEGLYRSGDGGSTWAEVGAGPLGQKKVKRVAVAPSDSNAIYAATADGVYGSADGGAKWQDLSKGTGLNNAMAIAFDPIDSATIWAATSSGLFRTAIGKPSAAPAAAATQEKEAAAVAPAEEKAAAAPAAAEEPAAEEKAAAEVKPEETKPAEKQVEVVTVEEAPAAKEAAKEGAAAAGPPIPTIDDVHTVLGQFSHEPSVQEIQEVAMRFGEVHPDLIESWRKGAKYKALLPKFKLSFDFDRDKREAWIRDYEKRTAEGGGTVTDITDEIEISPTTGTNITNTVETETSSENARLVITAERLGEERRRQQSVGFEFQWELGDFLYNPDQVRISDEARDLVELRNDILEEVTQFYFQRRQLQIDLLLSPSEDLRERLRLELQLQEVTANIDYLTGGYLTQRLNDVKQGKQRKSSIFKRLINI